MPPIPAPHQPGPGRLFAPPFSSGSRLELLRTDGWSIYLACRSSFPRFSCSQNGDFGNYGWGLAAKPTVWAAHAEADLQLCLCWRTLLGCTSIHATKQSLALAT
jgi:hypothetical protein